DPTPVASVAIDHGVIGQHASDGDAMSGEPGQRAVEEPSTGGVAFVVMDLGVGQTGVVVDRGVDEVIAVAPASDCFAAAVRWPAASGGDATQFLDVDVDHRARRRVLIAVLAAPRGTQAFASDRVD